MTEDDFETITNNQRRIEDKLDAVTKLITNYVLPPLGEDKSSERVMREIHGRDQ